MKLFTFKLKEPLESGVHYIACVGHDEEDARLRVIVKGYDLVTTDDEKKFINAFLEALNK